MSTKIYNGYRLEVGQDATFASVMDTISAYRSYMRETVERWMLKEHVYTATREHTLNTLEDVGLLVVKASDDKAKQKRKSSPWVYAHELRKDFGLSAPGEEFTFIVHQDPKDTQYLYLLVFSSSNKLTEAFENKFLGDSLVEYGYWDNSDRPEGVTDEEWDERETVWERIGVMNAGPSEIGLSVNTRGKYSPTPLDLGDYYPVLNEANANVFVPSFDERVDMGVEHLLTYRRRAEAKKQGIKESSYDRVMRIMNEVARARRDDTPEVQEARKEVARVLPQEITVQNLAFPYDK